MSKQSFRELGVSPPVVGALAARKIHEPFPIQERVLPDALAGLDVLVRSPTGSGKTLAFALTIVERTVASDSRPSALVLVPTRELAAQVCGELDPLAQAKSLSVAVAYGGLPLRAQAQRAKRAQILVATPGRLEDLAERRLIDLSGVRTFVRLCMTRPENGLTSSSTPPIRISIGAAPRATFDRSDRRWPTSGAASAAAALALRASALAWA